MTGDNTHDIIANLKEVNKLDELLDLIHYCNSFSELAEMTDEIIRHNNQLHPEIEQDVSPTEIFELSLDPKFLLDDLDLKIDFDLDPKQALDE